MNMRDEIERAKAVVRLERLHRIFTALTIVAAAFAAGPVLNFLGL